jgi:K+-sensing histidine kinase KdpD
MDENLKTLEPVLAKFAHDLRTPVAVIHTTTNMLLNPKYQFSPEQVREQHERILRNVEILNRLSGELAALAQGGAKSPVDGDAS